MALGFGRKKGTGEASSTSPETGAPASNVVPEVQAAPIAPHAPSSPPNDGADAFDLDAFALPASDGNSSGIDAFPAPISSENSNESGSAFDFPETALSEAESIDTTTRATGEKAALDFDDLFAVEQANAARSASQNVAANATSTAAPAPFVPPTATIQEPAVPFYEPQEPVGPIIHAAPQKPNRKLPLVPILGALTILGGGGAAAYFLNQGTSETEEMPPVAPSRPATRPEPPTAPAPPVKVVKTKTVPVAIEPLPGSANVVRPGIAPAAGEMAQMKALWRRGADAKRRRDYDGARRYWNQGLKIQPNNTGFKESIAKLPR